MRYIIRFIALSLFPFYAYSQTPPTVHFDSIKIGEIVHLNDTSVLHLSKTEHEITFFVSPDSTPTLFGYKMQGIDYDTVVSQYANIRYTNLVGGTYTFSIWKQNKPSQCRTIEVKIAKTIGEETWFLPLVVICLMLLVATVSYLWLVYNFRQKRKEENLRIKISSDLHDDVGSILSSISIDIRKLIRRNMLTDSPKAMPTIERVLQSAESTIVKLRDTVWIIKPENDTFDKLLARMTDFAAIMLGGNDIHLQLNNTLVLQTTQLSAMRINMEQRGNADLIFRELIHNIVKHAEASIVKIDITRIREGIVIRIEDNGKGFDPTQTPTTQHGNGNGTGEGLKSLHRRAHDSFIDLEIKSALKQGTRVKMLIPEI
jgi:signal transduction histidine kinase